MTHQEDVLLRQGQDYFLPVYQQRKVILQRGKRARVWDSQGNDYIDFSAGIAVNSLGHADPDLLSALRQQAENIWHTSNIFYSEPPISLAHALVEASAFAKRAYLCNSGTEANEAAIKLVRKWAAQQGRSPDQRVIITFRGGFHGRTLASVTATAQPKYQQGYEPLPSGFRYLDFNQIEQVQQAFTHGDVAAVMLEPVQGEGGVIPAAPGYLKEIRALCDQHEALLVIDEIQAGMSRTGTLFAHWQDEVRPDIVTLAKALGGGFPIGAMLVGERVSEVMHYGDHGTTFGGNPLAAAVANAALEKLNSPAVLANVAKQSEVFREKLHELNQRYALFTEIRGRGLMLGAELQPELHGKAAAFLDHLMDERLLLLQAGPNVLRFVPPLTITDEEVDEGFDRLDRAFASWNK